MSASEKLKALMERHDSERTWAEAQMDLYRALPQIVAVVEAAEATDRRTREIEQRHELSPNELSVAMRSALAALDEALS